VQEGFAETEQRHPGSRVLHAVDRRAARPTLALAVVTAVVVWVIYSAAFGFPARLETVFQTLAAATTLAMVFVIQHTQSRAQAATQRKLDEILRASPEARAPDIVRKFMQRMTLESSLTLCLSRSR
jgi:low affinity Fe/Cu permease